MASIDSEVSQLKKESIKKAQIVIGSSQSVDLSTETHYSSDESSDEDVLTKLNTGRSLKVLEQVDHKTIDYEPFRKNFYVEVPDISAMTPLEVDQFRHQLDGIRIRGKSCPRPIKTFSQAGLPAKLVERLKKLKFEKPTPIQSQALPAIMSGRDFIGIAKTGSGKTLAFVLPMIRHILGQRELRVGDGPIALVMAPTRELVTQIQADTNQVGHNMGLVTCAIYGGTGIGSQISDLKRGAHIVVATPGRMIELLCTNNGRVTNLRRVTFLVLDEADRMFDLGFGQQILKIVNNIRPDRQTVMFSATFPRQVEAAARNILVKPLEITVHGRSVVSDTIEQFVQIVPTQNKFRKLLDAVAEWIDQGSILIFAERQESVDNLFQNILMSGYQCMSFHSGKEQIDREEAIEAFKSGELKILIATSAAARGLDVPNLCLVVNYDVPNHHEDYIHRVGRTGRAGRRGTAITFLDPETEDKYAGDLIKALKDAHVAVPEELKSVHEKFEEKREKGLANKHSSGFDKGHGYKFTEEEERQHKAASMGIKRHFGADLIEDMSESEEDEEDEEQQVNNNNNNNSSKNKSTDSSYPLKNNTNEIGTNKNNSTNTSTNDTTTAIKKTSSNFTVIMPSVSTELVGDEQKAVEEKLKKILANKAKAEDCSKTVHFDIEIEINDFPQSVRWKVTHKDALADIVEYTGCAIAAKGVYVEPGKPVPLGQRKLHLSIEGPTQEQVNKAKAEIKKKLEEAISAYNMRVESNKNTSGRYSVLE